MQGFVKVRNQTSSPQNGQPPAKADRRAAAASAKVPMKNGIPMHQPQPLSGLPARGFGIAQNGSAISQQTQRRHSGQDDTLKRDPYDTDAASLDTTVNLSVVKLEDSQNREHAAHRHDQIFHSGDDDEEAGEGDEGSDEEGDEYSYDGHALAPEDEVFIQEQQLGHLSHEEKVEFLRQTQSGLPMVRGDSYPPTTDGDFSEWEGGQEVPAGSHDDVGPFSPSLQRPKMDNQTVRMVVPQPSQQHKPTMTGPHLGSQKPSPLFRQGADLRDQSRSTPPFVQHCAQGFQYHADAAPTSQFPTYGQVKVSFASEAPLHMTSQQNFIKQASIPSRGQFQPLNTKPVDSSASIKRPLSARTRAEPMMQQHFAQQVPVEGPQTASDCDYDYKVLMKMQYEDLKNQGFDIDPRARPPVLAEEDNQKELSERLKLVQRRLDTGQQSDFFNSLSTAEWEEAGDWFLEQFQSIIHRTRQARQKKRKLAQEFEDEVEKRHEHVSNKQHQVQQAMDKMKAQGEGLVSRSPKPPGSPRSRRG